MGRPSQGYHNAAGDKIPGTTTVIGRFKDSGGLIQWLTRLAAIMSACGTRQEAPRHLYDVVEKAGEAGTIAHDMIEAFILGKPTPTIAASDDVIAKASNAFQQFGEWHEQSRIEIIATERSYVSERSSSAALSMRLAAT